MIKEILMRYAIINCFIRVVATHEYSSASQQDCLSPRKATGREGGKLAADRTETGTHTQQGDAVKVERYSCLEPVCRDAIHTRMTHLDEFMTSYNLREKFPPANALLSYIKF